MFPRGSRVRLLLDSHSLPEGTTSEVTGFYRREGLPACVVRFPTEEHVVSAKNLELVEVTPQVPVVLR